MPHVHTHTTQYQPTAAFMGIDVFYEFWHQKHGVTFCFSFYSSNHNPFIAIDELTAFFHYLENTHFYVPALTIRSTTQTMPQRRTNIRYVHSIIRFIRYLIMKWSTKTGHGFRVFPEQSF